MEWQSASQNGGRIAKSGPGVLAERQFGRITWRQLRALGASEGTIHRWVQTGYLIRVLPRVYAVGHRTPDERAELFSIVLFAGPDAALSHGTSAYRRGWLRYPVAATHVSTPRRITSPDRHLVIHCRREVERELVNDIPCTTTTQTLLDLAATEDPRLVHRSLAQLDFERKLDARAMREACGRGKPGSAKLLKALNTYMPQLARTKSELEDVFLYLCQRAKLPLPQVNAYIHGEEVDCLWPELKLVVELDGHGNHGTASQRNRDQRKALKLRAHGLTILRYTRDQVFFDARQITADLQAEIMRLRATYPS
jgi:very-short-patch-repair endonuclease